MDVFTEICWFGGIGVSIGLKGFSTANVKVKLAKYKFESRTDRVTLFENCKELQTKTLETL